MRRVDFEKVAQAMAKIRLYEDEHEQLREAAELLREVFNANGGAERYLFSEE